MSIRHFYNKQLQERCRELRNNMTPAEKKLWYEFLRSFKPRVHRQRPIGPYIVDFYIPKASLVIEIDGDSHYVENAQEKDHERDMYCMSTELTVLRFTNTEVFESFDSVCQKITECVRAQGDTPPAPSGRGGKGGEDRHPSLNE